MCDCMEFPKTIDEFIKGYSFKDKEEVYTNGSELIQVFRVEQALEHYMKAERNKAIDEFAEKLKNSLLHNYRHFLTTDTDGFEWLTIDAVETHINELVKQLKGGSDDGFTERNK